MARGGDGFFRTLGSAFSFSEYEWLAEKKPSDSIRYFLKLMALATVLMFIAAVPAFINFSKNIDKVIDNFDSLKITVNASSKGPIIFFPGDRHREVTFDWESNATSLEHGKYLVAKDRVIKKTLIGSQYTNISGYSDVIEHRELYRASAMILAAFLMPSLVVGAYVFFGIKFFLMVLLLAAAALVITRIIRFDVEFRQCLTIAVYASTIGIILAMALFPYNIRIPQIPFFRIEWLGYALSLIYFIVGLRHAGYFEKRRNRKKELSRRKNYFQIKE